VVKLYSKKIIKIYKLAHGIELTSRATVPGCLAKTFHDIRNPSDCIGLTSGMMI